MPSNHLPVDRGTIFALIDSKVLLLAFPCIHSKGTVDMITKAAKAAFAIRSYPVKCNHATPVLT